MSAFFERASWVLHRIIILFKDLLINLLNTLFASWQLLSYLLTNITSWRLVIRCYKLRDLLLARTNWASDWFVDFFSDLALGIFSVWWHTELLSYGLFDKFGARWGTKFLPDWLLDPAFWGIVLESLFSIFIDRLIDFLIDLWCDPHLLFLFFFRLRLFKTYTLIVLVEQLL